jgi:glutamate 5-kinase
VDRRELLSGVRKLVVKIGTASLSNEQGGLDEGQVSRLAEQVLALRRRGIQTAVVSSGAIGAGMNALGLQERPRTTPELQACAAIGQGRLIALYEKCFRKSGAHAAQVLLTREDVHDRRRYLNAVNCFTTLAAYGAVPIINENDTVSVEEIDLTFGDNDRLAALVTSLAGADLLVLLTDVEGLYEDPDAPPSERRVVRVIEHINDDVRRLASSKRSRSGRGGMTSKLEAAKIAAASGAATLIAGARQPSVLQRIFDGEELGTLVLPSRERPESRKRWLRFGSRPHGSLVVDAGARRALCEGGKSLLPSGVREARGSFAAGALVSICDEQGIEIARGVANYSDEDIRRIMGLKTAAVRKLIGEQAPDEVVHRDHLALND